MSFTYKGGHPDCLAKNLAHVSVYPFTATMNVNKFYIVCEFSMGGAMGDPICPRLIDMSLSPPIGRAVVKGVTKPRLVGKNALFGPWSRSAQLVQFPTCLPLLLTGNLGNVHGYS